RGAVARFEALYFAVRERLGAADWVDRMAVRPRGPAVASRDLGEVWRALGYGGGPQGLDLVVAATTGRPLPAWVAAREAAGDGGGLSRTDGARVVRSSMAPGPPDPIRSWWFYRPPREGRRGASGAMGPRPSARRQEAHALGDPGPGGPVPVPVAAGRRPPGQ